MTFRTRILSTLLTSLANTKHPTPYFQTLSVVGVAGHNYKEIVAHPKFFSVFERIRCLNLQFMSKKFEMTARPHLFFGEFTSAWFAPVIANLTTLELLSESYWGYTPKIDLSQLLFPCLRVLALCKYTFSHDWQLEWITKHGEKLEKLYLYDCPIVTHTRIFGNFDNDGYPIGAVQPGLSDPQTRNYPATWSQYLGEMTHSLQELQMFKPEQRQQADNCV